MNISLPRKRRKMGHFRKTGTKLCEEERIPGVARISRMWLIPKDAKKPADRRRKEQPLPTPQERGKFND